MKTKINHLSLFALFTFFALLNFTACQDELTVIVNPDEQEAIVANSTLSNLMSRTTAHYGAADNILDGSSCFSVELPVTIIVSDITVIIETQDDLEQLENWFQDFNGDDDFLNFIFPITIIFSDYSQIVIENEDQLESFISQCNDINNDVIECVDFVYPITFSVFNSQFNLIDTVVIGNDEALYNFLDELENDDNALIVSLNYPINLVYANGETVEVNSNQELADAIEAAGDDCEDDDNCIEEEVTINLVECPWEVNVYTNNDLVNLDGPLNFNFNENGTVIIEGVFQEPYTTIWELIETDIGLVLHIESFYYYEAQFGNWLVVECDDDDLKFEHLTVDGTGLIFDQDCEDDLDCSLTDISTILQECPWDFSDGTDNFNNYQLVFNANGELLIPEGMAASAIGGAWSLSVTDIGIILTFSELTAFQNSLAGDWLIVACDDDRIEIVRGDTSLVLEQDCEGDLGCSLEQINANILECAWEFQTNLIDTLVVVYVYFTPNGQVLMSNNDGTENQIGTWNLVTIASGTFIDFTFEQGFEILNGQWQIVECEVGDLYLVNGNNYISLNQDCDVDNDIEVFNCFDDFELVECANDTGEAEFNLSADTIGLINCTASFTASFHSTLEDAQNNTNAISNTESYFSIQGEVYLRILANSGNYQIFTIYLNTVECGNPFECFQSFDAIIEVCDDGIDGPNLFNLTVAFANCTPSAELVSYHQTQTDAQTGVNVISNPAEYSTADVTSTIYIRVEINNQVEVFPIQLTVIDCNVGCNVEEVDSFLIECIWNAVNYNGSDNLIEWNFDFDASNQIVVIYTSDSTIDANWSTSQSDDGVIITFSNVAGSNIQAITGEWLVVECETNRLELHRANDILVLERTCN